MKNKVFSWMTVFIFVLITVLAGIVILLPLQEVKAAEVNSFDDYSSVFLSSRWWHDGTINEDFNSQPTAVAPQCWVINNQTGRLITVVEVPSSIDKSLKISDNDGVLSVNAEKSFDSQGAPIIVEFDFQIEQVNDGALVCNLLSEYDNEAVCIVTENGSFKYYDGTSLASIQTCTANTWYHFKLIVDPVMDKMDLYIDDILKVTYGNFKTNVKNISKIRVGRYCYR